MVQLGLILRLFMLATLRTAECSYDGLGAMSQGRKISKTSERDYVPFRGSLPNLFLSVKIERSYSFRDEQCKRLAVVGDLNFWGPPNCLTGKLSAPVCRVDNANETGYMIMKSFLTDGSPNDDPFPSTYGVERFMRTKLNVAFRVMTPTILEFPEFTTKIAFKLEAFSYSDYRTLPGKIFVFPKLGGIVTTDDSILVDPSCHTNNSCGVAFLTTSVEAFQAPHVVLDQICGQTIHLNDTPVLNVFSHPGIGCKLFPDDYPARNCELTITSPSAITANVTLVNFRKTTCDGYELKFANFTSGQVSKEVDVCKENAPTDFYSSEGKMQIKLTGRASENWHKYGFIIRLEKVTINDNSPECSNDNPVQGATEDFPQVSTTAPAESPTSNPVQNPTDGTDVDLPEASLESSSATEFISDPTGSFESESPSVSHKRQTNHHHLHLMLALGIEL